MSNENKTESKSKAEAPKADAANAAPHNPFAAFDPMAIWNAFQTQMNAWTQALPAFQNPWTASQQAFTNPVAAWTTTQQAMASMMKDSVNRAQAWGDEYASIEAQMVARANQAVDTWAQLAHDTINYTAQLSAQARKLSFEAAKRAGVGA